MNHVVIVLLVGAGVVGAWWMWKNNRAVRNRFPVVVRHGVSASGHQTTSSRPVIHHPGQGPFIATTTEPGASNFLGVAGNQPGHIDSEFHLAGVITSKATDDNTIHQLYRRMLLPGRDIGDEKTDTSEYIYRVRANLDGGAQVDIQLDRNISQLHDGDEIASIPGLEAGGPWVVDLHNQGPWMFRM